MESIGKILALGKKEVCKQRFFYYFSEKTQKNMKVIRKN